MFDISSSELLRLCQGIINYPPPFYSIQQTFVCDLYTTGCRPQEVLEPVRWQQSEMSVSYWTLQPLKGNFTREIPKCFLSDHLNDAITNQYQPYYNLSLRQLEYSMKQITSVGRVEVETKEMVAYIFRYNLVKMLIAAGQSNSEIQTHFGWKNPPMPWNYGSKQLKVTYFNIPTETYYLTSSNCFNLVDSDGSKIVSQS